MRRTVLLSLCWLAVLAACTPLGLWVYDDPALEVSQVAGRASDSTVTVALDVRNPNDYDLSTTRFELRLQVDGRTVGHYERDSIIPVPRSVTSTLSLPFIHASSARGRYLESLRAGAHLIVVEGRAVFSTPFGERRVRVVNGGAMAGDSVEFQGGGGGQLRPGLPLPNRRPSIWRPPEPRPGR